MAEYTKENAISRIRKLIHMNDKGTPQEAAIAWVKAQELLLNYNLSLEQIMTSKAPEKRKYIYKTVEIGSNRHWRRTLAHLISKAMLCHAVYVKGTNTSCIVGTQVNVDIVVEMINYIIPQLEKMAETQYIREGLHTYSKTKWKDAFFTGALTTIQNRLETQALIMQQEQEAAERAASGESTLTALIVLTDQEVQEAAHTFFTNMRNAPNPRKNLLRSGYENGLVQGKNVEIFRKLQ
jgi:hypothetical protein